MIGFFIFIFILFLAIILSNQAAKDNKFEQDMKKKYNLRDLVEPDE